VRSGRNFSTRNWLSIKEQTETTAQKGEIVQEIGVLIRRATSPCASQKEKQRAFGEIVGRFQDLAYGCAYAVLGDFQMAEDAAQEAFLAAWQNLGQLRAPEAFPGWFKRIVLTQCNRFTRGKRVLTVPLDAIRGLPSEEPEPQQALERAEFKEQVYAAIQSLPEKERMVTTLFYISEYSQNEVAAFLELPVTTIKKRLFCARQQLRERMLDMVRDALLERRPSRNESFAQTVTVFNEALETFLCKVKQDRNILAVLLFGSLSYDQVWKKSDIDIILISRHDKQSEREFALVENGVNIHAILFPRNKFKSIMEGALQNSFFHSSFAKSTLLYTTDETIREYYENIDHIGDRDRNMQLLRYASSLLYTLAKAEKWFYVKSDLDYSFLWIMYSIESLAKIETLLHGKLTSREVIQHAVKLNPSFFDAIYTNLIHAEKDAATIQAALDRINAYIDGKIPILFGPVLEYLENAGGVRTTNEINDYFRKQAQLSSLSNVYEWLADKGILQKVPSPMRLTEKSSVAVVDEAAYYYDGCS
jgi:RNA polymerase sigma factor (sigma-70 family)